MDGSVQLRTGSLLRHRQRPRGTAETTATEAIAAGAPTGREGTVARI